MISSIQKLFQVTDDNMNPWQPVHGLIGRSYLFQMILSFFYRVQSVECIGADSLSLLQMSGKKPSNRFSGDCRNSLHCHKASFFPLVFNGDQYRLFSGSTSATLASGFFATNIRVIKFNEVTQAVNTISPSHGSSNLLQHTTGGQPGDSDLFGKTGSGDTSFIRSSEIDSPEPLHKWYIGRVKQGAGSNIGLMVTLTTFINSAFGHVIGLLMSAVRTFKTFWPTMLDKSSGTRFFSTKLFLPIKQTHFRHFHGEILLSSLISL